MLYSPKKFFMLREDTSFLNILRIFLYRFANDCVQRAGPKIILPKFRRAVFIISEDSSFCFLLGVATPRIIYNNGVSLFLMESRL